VVGLIASALAVLPLRQILTDWTWVIDAWTAMAVAILPAAALRLRATPRAVHLLPGAGLVVVLLTMRYVPDNAVAGVLPLRGAWSDIATLSNQVGDTIRNGTAPLESTPGIRLLLTAQLVLLAIAVDLLAVVARRPALAGIPFLLIFTLAGAVPRHVVAWVWFAVAGAGYLLLLSSDAHDELARWGRIMPRTHLGRAGAIQPSAGRRIALVAIAVAVCLPFVVPTRSGNAIADALHNNGQGDGSGDGKGTGVVLGAFASLKGKLTRSSPVNLFSVDADRSAKPFYLRQEVLDFYDGTGWSSRGNGATDDLSTTTFDQLPQQETATTDVVTYQATIRIQQLVGNAPILGAPTSITGLPRGYGWSPITNLVVGNGMGKGTTYDEDVRAPDPSAGELRASPYVPPTAVGMARWLELPGALPTAVSARLDQVTAGRATAYDKARAISDYFTNPVNGFVYSLQTKDGDSGSDLVDFLTNKTGFCQQYAAAMGVMLREAGIPARVVLGYTHPVPDSDGHFVVTTNDAHAWVEAYFDQVGWIPFDPTPLAGGDAGRAVALPWAPHITPSAAATSLDPRRTNTAPTDAGAASSAAGAAATSSGQAALGVAGWLTWLLVSIVVLTVVLALVPASVRWSRRRARVRASVTGPDPLWAELADTATDLGYVWSPVRTPRQVVTWLSREGLPPGASGSLRTLAHAVEQSRYAPVAEPSDRDRLVGNLRDVSDALRARRSRGERWRAVLLPASLSWVQRIRAARRH
jgi:transglutaminase-like putative cysteine protease